MSFLVYDNIQLGDWWFPKLFLYWLVFTLVVKLTIFALLHQYQGWWRYASVYDLLGIIRRENIKPEQYGAVYEALKKENSDLKLWAVVYDRELDRKNWAGFEPFMDIVNLCVGNQTRDFSKLGQYLDQCSELFSDRPIWISPSMG